MRFRNKRKLGLHVKSRSRFGKSSQCVWCGISVTYRGECGPTRATREHVVPRSLGGGGGSNVAVACLRCNSTRGQNTRWVPWKSVPEWRRRVGVPMVYARGEMEPALVKGTTGIGRDTVVGAGKKNVER